MGACEPAYQTGILEEPCLALMKADTQEVQWFKSFPYMQQPVVSPDMNWIAYTANDRNHNWQVYVISVDGTVYRQLTNYDTLITLDGLAWSPDSQFISYRLGTYETDIHRISIDGLGDVVLVQNAIMPAWSPDGTSLAYMGMKEGSGGKSYYLFVSNADGTNPRQITPDVEGFDLYKARWPAWSPDSKLIAFVVHDTLYVAHADGSAIRPVVTDKGGELNEPSWQSLPSTSDIMWSTSMPTLTPTTTPIPTITLTPSVTRTPSATHTLIPTVNPANAFTAMSGFGRAAAALYTDQGEYLGSGYGDENGNFMLEGKANLEVDQNEVRFTLQDDDTNDAWYFYFYAPNLEVGRTYSNVERFGIRGNLPTMSVMSPGRSSRLSRSRRMLSSALRTTVVWTKTRSSAARSLLSLSSD